VSRITAAKHEEYAQARRDTILNAALRVFSQEGFAEAKMDQVAAAADLSKAALYLYFPSKDSLLQNLLKQYSLLPELPGMVASLRNTPPTLGIPTLIAEAWRRLRERKELARVIVREIQSNPERAKLFSEQVGLPAYQSVAGYLDHWMKRGFLRRQDALASAQCLLGMLWFFLLTQELMGGKELHPLSDETVVSTVARMFLDGATNRNNKRRVRPRTAAGGGRHQRSVGSRPYAKIPS
jgi:AcrR family transcriptional regulator